MEKGSKASFLSGESEKRMIVELGPFCPDLENKILKSTFSLTPEVWIEEKKVKFYKKPEEMSFYPAADIFDLSKVGRKKKLKKVDYYGPLKEGYGLFSSLMEIKDAHSFLRL